MTHWLARKPVALVCIGLGMGLLVGVGMLIGSLAGGASRGPDQVMFPETLLHAAGATGSEKMAIATGPIDEEKEGLFTLDFLTGELSCFVIYTKGNLAQKLGATYKTNVAAHLGGVAPGKKPHYLMVVGGASFLRGAAGGGAMRPANSVVYVLDTNTGKWVAYGMLWNPQSEQTGALQQAEFIGLTGGTIRSAPVRQP